MASIPFLDVEGAFPNAVTDRLIHNLRKRRIPAAYVGFIRRLLEGRKTRLKFDDFVSELISILNGIGQGDPLSMILYIIYNADLLEMLVRLLNEDSVGYVDDVIAVAIGEDFHATTAALENMMEQEDGGFAWSSTHNSRFEISKLAVLHAFRRTQRDPENPRKWIPLDRPPLRLQGKTVKEVESYKYLGILVHVDAQLRWTIQAQKGIANATKWVMQFRRLTRISTGLSIQLMRRLYIAVAIPKMTYAIDVWYTPPTKPPGHRRSVGSVGVLRRMTKLQRMASLGIVGGMRSTPTDLLDAHTGLLPIDLTLFRICHRAAVCLCSLPPSHPLHSIVRAAHLSQNEKHVDPIKSTLRIFELDPRKFKMISPDTTPPEHLAKIKAIIPREKDKAIIAELKDEVDLKIFTDSSGKDGWAKGARESECRTWTRLVSPAPGREKKKWNPQTLDRI